MTLPTYVGAGAAVSGTGAVTPALPAGWAENDVFLLVTENSENAAPATPSGWNLLGSHRGGIISVFSRLSIYWRRATASETDPITVADPGNHLLAQILAFRGADTTITPVTIGAFETGQNQPAWSAPGVTTTVDDCMIVIVGSNSTDSTTGQFPNAFVNASLANITTRSNVGTDASDGGSIGVATGEKATAGAAGNSTTATSNSSSWAGVHVVVLPAQLISGTASIMEVADTVAATGTMTGLSASADIAEASDIIATTGAVLIKASAATTEADDTVVATDRLLIAGTLSATEAGDTLSAAGTVALKGVVNATEAADTSIAAAAVALKATLSATEADDASASTDTVLIVGTFSATEEDDTVSALGRPLVQGALAASEEGDTLLAAYFPVLRVRPRGGPWPDPAEEIARCKREWERDLRRIIDQAFRVADGEIDPVTLEEIPPPDFSGLEAALAGIEQAADRRRAETFIAGQRRLQEDEAVAVLLLAA